MKSSRSQSSTRIHQRLETFLAQQQANIDHTEFYEQESCIQDNEKSRLFGKFRYCILIVCNDRVYLTDNPPKNLDDYINFEDIKEIKMVISTIFSLLYKIYGPKFLQCTTFLWQLARLNDNALTKIRFSQGWDQKSARFNKRRLLDYLLKNAFKMMFLFIYLNIFLLQTTGCFLDFEWLCLLIKIKKQIAI